MGTEVKKAVIYARYSSHGQTEQSIDGQLRDCYSFAERENLQVVGEYIDRALTGRSDDRPDFQRMINDSAKKQFDLVIVWKLDRFARNRYDSAMYKAKLKKHSVRVTSATENISDSPEGIILEGMLESMAEYYSANLSKHVKRGIRESLIKGTWTGGHSPIGYKVVDKQVIIDEERAPIIKYAFQQYADGVSKKQIVADLNARGIRSAKGRPLTSSSFQVALKNEKYIGIWRYNGEIVDAGFPPLIDKEIFNRVQRRLDSVRRAPAAKKAKVDYLLRGKAFCGMCGESFVGESGRSKSGTIYHYYACTNKKKRRSCKKKNERKGWLEWYIVEQTVKYVLSPNNMEHIADRIVEEYDKEFNDGNVRNLEKTLFKLESDINAAVDASIEAPAKVRERYYEKIELLETQKADIEYQIAQIRLVANMRYTKEQIIAWLKLFCNGDPLDESFQRQIIDVFVNSVYVYDDKIVTYYNIKGGTQVSYVDMLESTSEDDSEGISDDFKNVRISKASLYHRPMLEINYALHFVKCVLFLPIYLKITKSHCL